MFKLQEVKFYLKQFYTELDSCLWCLVMFSIIRSDEMNKVSTFVTVLCHGYVSSSLSVSAKICKEHFNVVSA